METKICSKCGIEKDLDQFRKFKTGYINSVCIACEYKQNMERYYKRKTRDTKYVEKKQIEKQNEILLKDNKKICSICKQIKSIEEFYFRKDLNKYRNWCIECEKSRTKGFYDDNKDYILDKQHKSYKENKEVILERKKVYAQKHKEQLKDYHKKYVQTRRKNDDIFHFKSQIRHLINQSFRRHSIQKKGRTEEIVGCDFNTFYKHLLETYRKNYGEEWDGKEKVHIDHIIPLYKAHTEEEIIKLCHYTNLQLLKEKDNLRKSNKENWNINKKRREHE